MLDIERTVQFDISIETFKIDKNMIDQTRNNILTKQYDNIINKFDFGNIFANNYVCAALTAKKDKQCSQKVTKYLNNINAPGENDYIKKKVPLCSRHYNIYIKDGELKNGFYFESELFTTVDFES